MSRLWRDGQTPAANTTGGGSEVGTAFVPLADGVVQGVLYFRTSGATANTAFRLWEAGNSTPLATATLSSGAQTDQGWQTCPIAETPITAGHTYIVSTTWVSGAGQKFDNPISPFNGADFSRYFECFNATAGSLPTGSGYQGEARAVDVLASFAPPTTTPGDLENSLTDWLADTGDNTHRSGDAVPGLPATTKVAVDALQTQANGASGFDAIKSTADTIATSVGSGLRTAVTSLASGLVVANTALVHAATTWSDALASALQTMSDDAAAWLDGRVAQGAPALGSSGFPSPVGTLIWTMLDETDFAGSIAWAQPADVYVLSITTRPIGLPLNLTDGVHTIYRCGWWTPLNGSFARQRSYIDFEDSHLTIGNERMPGVLVSLQPGGEGHLQAWSLT